MKQDLSDIKSNLNSVVDQTSDLTEFETQTNQNFNDIKETLKFLLHKEIETEKEIFKLKQIKENKLCRFELNTAHFLFHFIKKYISHTHFHSVV